jgi:hypothetical protein
MTSISLDFNTPLVINTSTDSSLFYYLSNAKSLLNLKLYCSARQYITDALVLYPNDFELTYLLVQSVSPTLDSSQLTSYYNFLFSQLESLIPKSTKDFDSLLFQKHLASLYLQKAKILYSRLNYLCEYDLSTEPTEKSHSLPSKEFLNTSSEATHCAYIYSKIAYTDPEGYFITGQLENMLAHVHWSCNDYIAAENYFTCCIHSYTKAIKLARSIKSSFVKEYREARLDSILSLTSLEQDQLQLS